MHLKPFTVPLAATADAGIPSEKRSALLPDVQTFAEAGLPGFNFVTWMGFFAPKGTPRPIINLLNAETTRAVADPDVRQRLLAAGLEPASSTPEELGERVRVGYQRVAKIVREANIKPE